ncbi:hypothetical protein LPTSP2_38680 [Leptospira ellinghausenii]|uniref:Uncharacterized protein n=1 Tax=Leptospira ellinghausenii TaxID=1917822 RepID=A0A2P2DIW5_9LEPT|nr:hypothetical protein [Leptospira ellinghausenii]GBF44565.1 hypothetical protein LPTSP2_38680 [Leptospira ellinghausenii]
MLSNITEGLFKSFTLDHLSEVNSLIKDLELHQNAKQPLAILNRLQIAILNKLEIPFRKIYGQWNGYGYPTLGRSIDLRNGVMIQEIIELLNNLHNFYSGKTIKRKQKRKIITEEDNIKAWANRLAKLVNASNDETLNMLTMEEALEIAEAKIQNRERKIEKLAKKQFEKYSKPRQHLINILSRKKPLQRIENISQAKEILEDYYKYNKANYYKILKDKSKLTEFGIITFQEIDDDSNSNMTSKLNSILKLDYNQ